MHSSCSTSRLFDPHPTLFRLLPSTIFCGSYVYNKTIQIMLNSLEGIEQITKVYSHYSPLVQSANGNTEAAVTAFADLGIYCQDLL